ncbi:MAG TPA: PrsW family intramembrane metalloprotease, partial [Corynebacterium sp.]|nr:PrsW family intramembrane metalloprotease [Corynebacterium sp.]
RALPIWPVGGAGAGWVFACLLWGSGIAILASYLTGTAVMDLARLAGWEAAMFSFGGAYPEEIGKALGVVVILMTFRGLNRPWHGLATGALVGLGFEVSENIGYGAIFAPLDPSADWIGALLIWGLRTVAGPFLHILWTGLAGWGIGLALFTADRTPGWRARVSLIWLLIPFALHFAWNYTWGTMAMTILAWVVNALIFYPLSIWVFTRAIRLARSDASYSFTPHPMTRIADLPADILALPTAPDPLPIDGIGTGRLAEGHPAAVPHTAPAPAPGIAPTAAPNPTWHEVDAPARNQQPGEGELRAGE